MCYGKTSKSDNNIPTSTQVNKIENTITFKIKTGYYLELLTPETMKLIESTKNKVTKNKNIENVLYLKITEVVLGYCNIVNNNYQQASRVFCTFISNKSFDQLLDFSPKHFIFSKTFNSDFSFNEVWFTDQYSKPLEIEEILYLLVKM